MQTTTQISTTEGARIAKRLLNHWKHKFEVQQNEQDLLILMPDYTITLTPQAACLDVKITGQVADFSHIQKVVIDHLNRMAHTEFSVTWH
ncbi:DUF2218 domain-containing protein [uncultured Acinetobacter sp.]|uniref:DUF2218 domain-containing protein n=1 Tax=uncultured Acinetobacter sp. TaxID=165433 RepID=UPI0026069BF7|nr:DUF2218 domain-containing protein [uncultured Acinetobacter sp.]